MKSRKHTFLLSAMLWLSIFLIDSLTACAWVSDRHSQDTQPPQITGIQDYLVYAGAEIDFQQGVEVTDDQDEHPVLVVDSSTVDLRRPGSYVLTYQATDASGNHQTETAAVTVLEKKEGYVDFPEVYGAVDKQLEVIVTDKMDARQKVTAIYNWVRQSLQYSGHSEKGDPYQAAYLGLKQRSGDCYTYFAVCKLMFDRLGIPNLDVVKIKNNIEDSLHFWSLVSVDGGETYYHFDATPRVGDGDDFCMVTDAFLDAYSEAHNFSHNRNTTLYPATPEA